MYLVLCSISWIKSSYINCYNERCTKSSVLFSFSVNFENINLKCTFYSSVFKWKAGVTIFKKCFLDFYFLKVHEADKRKRTNLSKKLQHYSSIKPSTQTTNNWSADTEPNSIKVPSLFRQAFAWWYKSIYYSYPCKYLYKKSLCWTNLAFS